MQRFTERLILTLALAGYVVAVGLFGEGAVLGLAVVLLLIIARATAVGHVIAARDA